MFIWLFARLQNANACDERQLIVAYTEKNPRAFFRLRSKTMNARDSVGPRSNNESVVLECSASVVCRMPRSCCSGLIMGSPRPCRRTRMRCRCDALNRRQRHRIGSGGGGGGGSSSSSSSSSKSIGDHSVCPSSLSLRSGWTLGADFHACLYGAFYFVAGARCEYVRSFAVETSR
jgi:hypothetical protein